jgi:EAL domain-containing protein (putative c-di-GMP-specific phosphodiesterase class I)
VGAIRAHRTHPRVAHALSVIVDVSALRVAAAVAALLVATWLACVAGGGSRTVLPHLFYVPILVAASRTGARGAAAAAVAAGLLAGPLLPLDVAAGTAQTTANWLLRLGMFLVVGQVMAVLSHWSHASIRAELDRRKTVARLQRGLARGELFVDYQPVVTIDGRRIVGAEALVRWRDPQRGIVPPGDFIPAAEASGAIVELGEFVLREATRQLAAWRAETGNGHLFVSVNVAAAQLSDAAFAGTVAAILDDAPLDPSALHLELTETGVLADVPTAAAVLAELRRLGVRICIDDFGTGQSSLAYLDRLPVDTVKIDRSFVTNLDPAHEGSVAAGIVGLAHALGFDVIAEGVEEQQQAEALAGIGCRQAQGYLFHRPMAPAVLTALLAAGDQAATPDAPARGARVRSL